MCNNPNCPFCRPAELDVVWKSELAYAIYDRFPVSPGHALVIPTRHCPDWFEATPQERQALLDGVDEMRRRLDTEHHPDGYNIGINAGAAAGQTIFHLHVHLIPRHSGDVPNPRGGVRHVIPGKGNYQSLPTNGSAAPEPPHAKAIIVGASVPSEPDPLLPHLAAFIQDAHEIDILVAFLLPGGLTCVEPHLLQALERGARVRLLTGDYLATTDPEALQRLLTWPPDSRAWVFECDGQSFHPKSWIFRWKDGRGVAFVGSSNLSRTALTDGIEWNARISAVENPAAFASVSHSFDRLLAHPQVKRLTPEWITEYRTRWNGSIHWVGEVAPTAEDVGWVPEHLHPLPLTDEGPPRFQVPARDIPTPNSVQTEALEALADLRAAGGTRALVVLATGLGKTWLAAFDSRRPQFRRVLFVAHREEILKQAHDTFERIHPDRRLGLLNGERKNADVDILFASVYTLGQRAQLDRYGRDHFDYIIVDEFHHAVAASYRRVLDHFTPRFFLGLTATPERTDGADLLHLCDRQVAYDCDLREGMRRDLLTPLDYYGVPDDIDYAQIPWRSGRFDEEALDAAVANPHSEAARKRADNALEQWRQRGGLRTLAFCVSRVHADFMAAFFSERGIRVAAVHSASTSAPREESLQRLRDGDLQVLFAVDMFNEGLDIPNVDTVMMLRPTESRIIFLQQLGRGLRKHPSKKRLVVIDYIGNHRSFVIKPQALFNLLPGDISVARLLADARKGRLELAPGCFVTYDLEAINLLERMLRTRDVDVLELYFADFRDQHEGVRPTAVEALMSGLNPRAARKTHGSWLGLAHALDGMTDPEKGAFLEVRDFLDMLETTRMVRSYKMLILLAMLSADRLLDGMSTSDIGGALRPLLEQTPRLRRAFAADFGDAATTDWAQLERTLRENPLHFLSTGPDGRFFKFENDFFKPVVQVSAAHREAFVELAREIVEWRLEEYLQRTRTGGLQAGGEPDSYILKVSHSSGNPILRLPDRADDSGLPSGWTDVTADDERYEANFVKVAVNVMRRPNQEGNVLPEILRRWFGKDAGQPRTAHRVLLRKTPAGWVLRRA